MNQRRGWAAAAAVVLLVGSGLTWWLLRADGEDDGSPVGAGADRVALPHAVVPRDGTCRRAAERPFTPRQVAIEGIGRAEVTGVPRDDRGVTGVLPISDKLGVAWDLGGVRPGSPRGNVLLNTHTWPDGSALGNALLERLDEGDRIVLHGSEGARSCYRVTREVEVLASEGYPPYYEDDGAPRVAIVVCSGTRDAAGEWSHRTIWFARPVS